MGREGVLYHIRLIINLELLVEILAFVHNLMDVGRCVLLFYCTYTASSLHTQCPTGEFGLIEI